MAKNYLKETKFIRVKRRVTDEKSLIMAYVMLNITAEKDALEDTCNIEITPLIRSKDENVGEFHSEEVMDGIKNRFTAKVDFADEKVTFFTGDLLVLSPGLRGLGIGSYAFSLLVDWAQKRYPNCMVSRIPFRFQDYKEENESQRAIAFYEKFGFEFEMNKDDSNGDYIINMCSSIKKHFNKDRIDELNMLSFMQRAINDRYHAEKRALEAEKQLIKDKLFMGRFDKNTTITFLLNVCGGLLIFLALILLK